MLDGVLADKLQVTIGVATAGWAIAPKVAEALPLAPVETGAAAIGDLVEKAQPRRRRWVCWWSRSRRRRVCGWRCV